MGLWDVAADKKNLIVSLSRCLIVSLSHCLIVSLSHCLFLTMGLCDFTTILPALRVEKSIPARFCKLLSMFCKLLSKVGCCATHLAECHVQYHHQNETHGKGYCARVGVFALLGLGDKLLDNDIEHCTRRKGQKVG